MQFIEIIFFSFFSTGESSPGIICQVLATPYLREMNKLERESWGMIQGLYEEILENWDLV